MKPPNRAPLRHKAPGRIFSTRQLATKLRGPGVPVVNVSGSRREGLDFPRVTSDAEAVVRMAVAHLHEKGLRHVTFCGESQRPFIDFWTEAYQNVMAEPGTEAVIYQPSARIGPQAGLAVRQNERRRWIESLPKPVGIIGWATGTPVFKKHHGSTPARHRANARLGRRGRSRLGPVAPSSRWP